MSRSTPVASRASHSIPRPASLSIALFLAFSATACAHALGEGFGEGPDALGDGGAGGCDGDHGVPASSSSSSGNLASSSSSSSASSSSSSSSSGHVTSSSSSSGGGACDNTGQCDTCANCSINGACFGAMSACDNDADCMSLMDCLSTCQDQGCADACANSHPVGAQLYMDLMSCVLCQACYSDCDGAGSGACF